MTDVDPVPTTAAEFVAAMRVLKTAAHVGFRTLEKRAAAAGDVLPRSTLVAVLSRDTLPREEVVSAFVRACGLGEDAVAKWLALWRHIAGGTPTLAASASLPLSEPPAARPAPVDPGLHGSGWLDLVPPAIRRGSWPLRLTALLLMALVAVITVAAVVGAVRDWTQSAP